MKNNLIYSCIAFAIAIFAYACIHDDAQTPPVDDTVTPRMTVDEARAFFDERAAATTRAEYENYLPFVLGDPTLDWDAAATSASTDISSVDIPVSGEKVFLIVRNNAAGETFEVRTHAKIIVVKSHATGEKETYIRICIPDEMYADLYDGNICDMTLNCEDRVDYCGLEYYATVDGLPIAAVRYEDGRIIDNVCVFDQTLQAETIARRFARMMGNTWIIPDDGHATRASAKGKDKDWVYGAPGSMFWGDDNNLYINLDNDGDGTTDSITDVRLLEYFHGTITSSSGGGSGSIGGTTEPGTGIGTAPPPSPEIGYGGGASGNRGSGGSSGGNGDGTGDTPNVEDPDDPEKPAASIPSVIRNPNIPNRINPVNRYILISDDIWNGGGNSGTDNDEGPKNPEEIQDKQPCISEDKTEANPVYPMQISDDNLSWRSNTWGYVRNGGTRFHDGLDLLGEPGVTKVHAIYGGRVIKVVFEQPNRIGSSNGQCYPEGYTGDTNGAGNRVTIESTLPDGEIIYVSYWHLDTTENNDYTCNLKIGNTVQQGQIIGVVGTSGNAYRQKPHLHIKTYIKDSNARKDNINNPINYLYTKFDANGNIIRDC